MHFPIHLVQRNKSTTNVRIHTVTFFSEKPYVDPCPNVHNARIKYPYEDV